MGTTGLRAGRRGAHFALLRALSLFAAVSVLVAGGPARADEELVEPVRLAIFASGEASRSAAAATAKYQVIAELLAQHKQLKANIATMRREAASTLNRATSALSRYEAAKKSKKTLTPDDNDSLAVARAEYLGARAISAQLAQAGLTLATLEAQIVAEASRTLELVDGISWHAKELDSTLGGMNKAAQARNSSFSAQAGAAAREAIRAQTTAGLGPTRGFAARRAKAQSDDEKLALAVSGAMKALAGLPGGTAAPVDQGGNCDGKRLAAKAAPSGEIVVAELSQSPSAADLVKACPFLKPTVLPGSTKGEPPSVQVARLRFAKEKLEILVVSAAGDEFCDQKGCSWFIYADEGHGFVRTFSKRLQGVYTLTRAGSRIEMMLRSDEGAQIWQYATAASGKGPAWTYARAYDDRF